MATPTSNTPLAYSPLTISGVPQANMLIDGLQWANNSGLPATTISYSFVAPGSSFFTGYDNSDSTMTAGIQQLNGTQQAAFKSALQSWANVANLNFVASADNASTVGDIRVGFSTTYNWGASHANGLTIQDYALSTPPSALPDNGDIWLNPGSTDAYYNDSLSKLYNSPSGSSSMPQGGYEYFTLLHELGHALGLKHPFETSALNPVVANPDNTASSSWDAKLFTVMSYTPVAGTQMVGFTFNPTTPMLLDIAAMQALYGANTGYNAGDTVYRFNDNAGQYYFQTLWDGGGHNTIDYSGNTAANIDLRAGDGSVVGNPVYAYDANSPSNTVQVKNLWIAYGTHIDAAIADGSGNNVLTANNDGDTLTGGSGNDTFYGGTGNDVFTGGGGHNVMIGNGGLDTAVYAGFRASYQLQQQAGASLPTYTLSNAAAGIMDTLTGISRLQFADTSVALDLNGNAGTVAKVLGAVFGPASVANAAFVGIGLKYLDGNLMNEGGLTELALNARLGAGFTNTAEVNLLYQNLVGALPDANTLAYWNSALTANLYTQGTLALMAVELPLNASNIHLSGQLSVQGLPYIPMG